MINTNHLLRVIRSTLQKFDELGGAKYSEEAVQLLLMIAAHESERGTYLYQLNDGPALGIYQHEPETIRDIYRELISKNRTLDFAVSKFTPGTKSLQGKDFTEIAATDLRYATVLARCHFMRFKEPIPTTEIQLGEYAKKYWNTTEGAASIADYVHAYRRACAGIKKGV